MGKSDNTDTPNLFQENSLQSLEAAFASGADFVEVDLVLDADRNGWLIHSSNLSLHCLHPPTTFLDQLTFDQVAELTGFGRQPICSLAELLAHFADKPVNVELKLRQSTGRPRDLDGLEDLIRSWPQDWWLSSFDALTLEAAQSIWPNTELGLLTVRDCPGQPYPDSHEFTNEQGAKLAESKGWLLHAQCAHQLPDTSKPMYLWSMGPEDEVAPEKPVAGLITDRIHYWQGALA